MTLALTGASGQLGRRVADLLLDVHGVDPAALVLLSRTPETLTDLAERGADVRPADFADPDGLRTALAGVDRLLIVSLDVLGPTRVALQTAAVEAAAAAGVGHLLYTSLPRPELDNPALVAADHRLTEEAILATGVDWTFLRNSLYAELKVGELAGAAATGAYAHNMGAGRAAYVSREDCAAAAAAALVEAAHTGRAYDITGPELLDADDVAAVFSAVSGRPVAALDLADDTYEKGLLEHGVPAPVVPVLSSFGRAIREGYLDLRTDDVATLTGRAPRTLADVLR